MIRRAYLAGGCFWGLEELFREQPGITDTEVGYCGGQDANPTYEHHLGHAETIELHYDDTRTTYAAILDFFFRIHDPTTRNQQGNDVGSSYRSTIFYQSVTEREVAERAIQAVNLSGLYHKPVVTTLEKFTAFYTAEEYHQDYLRKNPGGYTCHFIRSDKPLMHS